MIKALFAAASFGALAPALATAEEPLSFAGVPAELSGPYLVGAAQAVAAYSAMQMNSDAPTFFCPPTDRTFIDAESIMRLAGRSLSGPHDPQIIVMSALLELQQEYPCQ